MTCHPNDMPSDHSDRCEQYARIEPFLAHAAHGVRNDTCEHRYQQCTDKPHCQSRANPASAARYTTGSRSDNTDDEGGFEDFSKYE